MEFKIVVLGFAIIGISSAGVLPAEKETRPKYETTFTGDIKSPAALNKGDIVKEGKRIVERIINGGGSLKAPVQRQPLHVKAIISPLKKKPNRSAAAYLVPAAYLTNPNATSSVTKSDLIYYSPLKSTSAISSVPETYSAPPSSTATKAAPVYYSFVPASYSPSSDSYSDSADYLAPTFNPDALSYSYEPPSYAIPSVKLSPLIYSVPASQSGADYYTSGSDSYQSPDDY